LLSTRSYNKAIKWQGAPQELSYIVTTPTHHPTQTEVQVEVKLRPACRNKKLTSDKIKKETKSMSYHRSTFKPAHPPS